MANVFSVRGYEKIFGKLAPMFLKGNQQDVKDAIEISKKRQSGEMRTMAKDGEMRLKYGSMPMSVWFNPALAKALPKDFNTAGAEEHQAFWEGASRVWNNLKIKRKGRFV